MNFKAGVNCVLGEASAACPQEEPIQGHGTQDMSRNIHEALAHLWHSQLGGVMGGTGCPWLSPLEGTTKCLDFVTQFPQGENFCRIWALGANVQLHRHRDQVPHASHGHVSGKC